MKYIEVFRKADNTTLKQVYNGYIKDDDSILEKFCGAWSDMPPTMQGNLLHSSDCVVKIDDNFFTLTKDGDEEKLIPYHVENMTIEDMDGVMCLALLPGQEPFKTRIKTDLKSLQLAVSDHREPALIEYSYPWPDAVSVLGNEEAKLINMSINREINGEVYAGPIFILAEGKNGDFEDISDELISKCLSQVHVIAEEEAIDIAPYLTFFGYYD